MAILRDDGLYRHLRFRRPTTWAYGFDITTWPGYLCFSGDMGCYVFSRIPDMLEFFRDGRSDGQPLRVDLGYWSEKVQAMDRCGGLETYSPDRFREAIDRWLDDAGASHDLRMAVADEVLSRADDGEHEAVRAAMGFEHDGFQFDTFWEVRVREPSVRIIWCCYALAWAVRKYDERALVPAAGGAPGREGGQ